MWLLIFPEGTNASDNGRRKSAQWAEKTGIKDMEHQLLPRSTGMFFCLNELDGTVDYVYDCTLAYEGIPSVSLLISAPATLTNVGEGNSAKITTVFDPCISRADPHLQSTCTGAALP